MTFCWNDGSTKLSNLKKVKEDFKKEKKKKKDILRDNFF